MESQSLESPLVNKQEEARSSSSFTSGLLLSTFVVVAGSFCYGCAMSYSSPAQSKIMEELGLSVADYSFFTSVMTFGGMITAAFSGKISALVGRRQVEEEMAYEDYDLGLNSPFGSDYDSDERVQYADEGSYSIPSEMEHNRPETEIGIPKQCYCGAEPLLDTCYSRNDPGRRFYTCGNRDDGDMHIWKWWDLAVTEELRAKESIEEQVKSLEYATTEAFEGYETDLNRLKDQQKESEVKNARLEKLLAELGKKKPMFNLGTELVVVGCLALVVVLVAMVMLIK